MQVTAKDFGKVALLMGGISAEREVSLMSGAVVLEGLQAKGINVCPIDAGPDVIQRLLDERPDRVFNILHGRGGEDGVMQGALEQLSIPYTGSGVAACALSMDKQRTKWVWQRLDLPTLPFMLLSEHFSSDEQPTDEALKDLGAQAIESLGLPVCVKPVYEGSSIGVTRVASIEEFPQAYRKAQQYGGEVMAEPWLDGGEYTVCILNDQVLPIIHIQAAETFYDYQAKYFRGDTQYTCPCELPAAETDAVQALALQAFKSLGCTNWGRVDMVRDAEGKFWLLEVNTAPGMTKQSLMPRAAKAAGIEIPELVWNILLPTLEIR